jgi:hypothetical protein
MVDPTDAPYSYVGDDPVNAVDPLGDVAVKLEQARVGEVAAIVPARKLEPAKPAQMSQVLGSETEFSNEVSDRLFESVEVAA